MDARSKIRTVRPCSEPPLETDGVGNYHCPECHATGYLVVRHRRIFEDVPLADVLAALREMEEANG